MKRVRNGFEFLAKVPEPGADIFGLDGIMPHCGLRVKYPKVKFWSRLSLLTSSSWSSQAPSRMEISHREKWNRRPARSHRPEADATWERYFQLCSSSRLESTADEKFTLCPSASAWGTGTHPGLNRPGLRQEPRDRHFDTSLLEREAVPVL